MPQPGLQGNHIFKWESYILLCIQNTKSCTSWPCICSEKRRLESLLDLSVHDAHCQCHANNFLLLIIITTFHKCLVTMTMRRIRPPGQLLTAWRFNRTVNNARPIVSAFSHKCKCFGHALAHQSIPCPAIHFLNAEFATCASLIQQCALKASKTPMKRPASGADPAMLFPKKSLMDWECFYAWLKFATAAETALVVRHFQLAPIHLSLTSIWPITHLSTLVVIFGNW